MKYLENIEDWASQIWDYISGLRQIRGVDGIIVKMEKNIPVIGLEKHGGIGGDGVEPYNGMFTCVDNSYTDASDNKHNEVICTVGYSYVPPKPLEDPPVDAVYDPYAGVAKINSSSFRVASQKFTITASGYVFLSCTYNTSSYTIQQPVIQYGSSIPTGNDDVCIILGAVVFYPADGSTPAYIKVHQVWEWEQIIDFVFASCGELGCDA